MQQQQQLASGIAVSVAALAIGLLSTGCGQGGPKSSQAEPDSSQPVSTEVATLDLPLDQCRQEHADCTIAADNTDELLRCDQALEACLNEASDAVDELAADLDQCRQDARSCVQEAGLFGKIDACRTELEDCVRNVASNVAPELVDALPRTDETLPPVLDVDEQLPLPTVAASTCLDVMGECVSDNVEPLTCSVDARSCLSAELSL